MVNSNQFITIPMNDVEFFHLEVWIKVGSYHDYEKKQGLAHLVEHLVLSASKHNNLSTIQYLGGEVHGRTNYDYTCYSIAGHTDLLQYAIQWLDELTRNINCNKDNIRNEIKVIEEEMKLRKQNEKWKWQRTLLKNLFIDTPYEHPVFGYETSLNNCTEDDVKKFFDEFYNENRLFCVYLGNNIHNFNTNELFNLDNDKEINIKQQTYYKNRIVIKTINRTNVKQTDILFYLINIDKNVYWALHIIKHILNMHLGINMKINLFAKGVLINFTLLSKTPITVNDLLTFIKVKCMSLVINNEDLIKAISQETFFRLKEIESMSKYGRIVGEHLFYFNESWDLKDWFICLNSITLIEVNYTILMIWQHILNKLTQLIEMGDLRYNDQF